MPSIFHLILIPRTIPRVRKVIVTKIKDSYNKPEDEESSWAGKLPSRPSRDVTLIKPRVRVNCTTSSSSYRFVRLDSPPRAYALL